MSLGTKATGKQSLYKLKTDHIYQVDTHRSTLHLAGKNHLGGILAAAAYIGTEQEVLTIVEEYGSSAAQMDVSLA